jgi:Fur family ferric uptake transcriptional regulator
MRCYGDPVGADLHETAALRLRAAGQRYTGNRRAVVDVLATTSSPPSIPELLAAHPELHQSSAYRNLAVLEHAGVVRRLVTSGDFTRYELAEDLTEHHHHLICSSCGAVEDYTVPPALERRLTRAVSEVEGLTGFSAEHHRLDLIGTCAACA